MRVSKAGVGVMKILVSKSQVRPPLAEAIRIVRKPLIKLSKTNVEKNYGCSVSREALYFNLPKFPPSSIVDVSLLKTTHNILSPSLLSGTRRTAGELLQTVNIRFGRSPKRI